MIESACLCGDLKLQIEAEMPAALTSCNCSACRRYGGLFAYFHPSTVKVLAAPGATDEYSRGDKSLAFVRCGRCGCLSHWRSLDPKQTERMGVNARLFTNVDISKVRIRRFDGADTWKYLD
jgi:hypothetical protein